MPRAPAGAARGIPDRGRYRRRVADYGWWVVAGVLLVAFVVLLVRSRDSDRPYDAWSRHRRRRPPRDRFRQSPAEPTPLKRAAVIINPTKFDDLVALRTRITEICSEHGWGPTIFAETTVDDPGTGQARAALADGADLICPLGGDGTVRAVGKALVGSEVPLGLLPAGTGNLLARNLDLPLDSIESALEVALTGHNRTIDVGRIVIDRSGEDHAPTDDVFLVMAGIGFDAAVMADADDELKAQVGYAAYIVSGLRNMYGPQFKIRMSVDGALPFTRRTKTVLLGNCGRIFGGLVLLPQAKVDDGLLDAVVMSPKGIVGWTGVLARVVSRQRKGHAIVSHHTGTEFVVRLDRPEELQLDGDTMGPVRTVTVTAAPAALVVRVAPPQ